MDRAPICNQDAEEAVLSASMLSREAWDITQEILAPEDFFIAGNRFIFESLLALDRDGSPFDLVTVANWLKTEGRLDAVGGTPKLHQVVEATPALANIGDHAKIVAGLGQQRRLVDALQIQLAEGREPQADPLEFCEKTERAICEAARVDSVDEEPTDLGKAAAEVIESAQERAERGDALLGHRSGLDELDRRIAGWCPGLVYVIAGRPGMGKTAFVYRVLRGIAEHTRKLVVLVSLEMPKDQMGMRALACEARVNIMDIRNGHIREKLGELTTAATTISSLPISMKYKPGATLREVRSIIRRALIEQRQKHGRDLEVGAVAIDYLQLMRGTLRKGGNREQEISELSRGVKEMAGELNCPVLALSQLNRSVETRSPKERRPQLADLRESGAIEQDADTVIFMYRDEYYFEDSPDQGLAEAIVAKQRNGPTGTVKLVFRNQYTLFDNLADVRHGYVDDISEPLAPPPWEQP